MWDVNADAEVMRHSAILRFYFCQPQRCTGVIHGLIIL